MAETKYIFSIAEDTKNGAWDQEHMSQSIHNSSKFHRELLLAEEVSGNMELTFHDSLPTAEEEYLEYLVSQHDGSAVEPDSWKTSAGAMVVSPTYGMYEEAGRYKGSGLAAYPQCTTIEDLRLTTEIYLQGAHFWIHHGNWGDFVDFSVVDKDDILGLFAYYSLTPGEDVLELAKYVENFPIKPGDSEGDFYPPSYADVASGLYLRVKYENNSNEGTYMGVTYLTFER